jgi:phosphate transport system permease protein
MMAHTGNSTLYLRRRIANSAFIVLSLGAAVFGLVWLAFILGSLLSEGVAALSPSLFTRSTPPPGMEGGLSNAILGSVLMSLGAVAIGTPIGLMAGTYLAEYGRNSRLAFYVRFVNDILLSAPSIVIGLFIYVLMVKNNDTAWYQMLCIKVLGKYCPTGHFSAWAGMAALAVIVIPVVVRTTENMLLLVPNGLREAASALGAPMNFVIHSVTWRAARAGIVTGVLLAVARISGETAPLLFTAFGNQFQSWDLNAPMASLPAVIFQYALSPYDDWHRLAWAGALLITATVLTLSIVARLLEGKKRS